MLGRVFISGQIGSFEQKKGVELIDIVEQVRKQPGSTSWEVSINNSEGGSVQVGDDIYDYLESLDKKTPVTTVAKGLCASITTKIFMAGSRRVIHEDCQFMIHLPMIAADYLNSQELEWATEEMKSLDNKMVDFYSKSTGTEKEAIYPLMRNETFLTADQALNLGFATEKREPIKAVAYINNSQKETKMNEITLSKEDKNWFLSQIESMSKLFSTKKINLIIQDENGMEINFPDLEDTSTPSVGDVATVEGVPAEGSYIMPSLGNATAVFSEGILTEIIEPEAEDADEIAALKQENEDLKNQIEALNLSSEDNEKKFKDLETSFLNFKRNTTTKFNLDKKNPKPDPKELEGEKPAITALNKLKEKRKI